MTSINTTADLLRLLREDPDFRDEVRALLLSQELLELPERFARFEAYVEQQFTEIRGDIARNTSDIARNTSDIARNTSDIARNTSDISEIRSDISEIRSDVARNTSGIGGLRGAQYERRAGRNFPGYASMAFRERSGHRLRRNRLLLSSNVSEPNSAFLDLIADAVDSGLIDDEEWRDLQQADAVMSGQHEGNTVYFVGEFSITVNNRDLDRAIARAAILAKATGCDAWPMVIGDTIPEPQRARAEAEGVVLQRIEE